MNYPQIAGLVGHRRYLERHSVLVITQEDEAVLSGRVGWCWLVEGKAGMLNDEPDLLV